MLRFVYVRMLASRSIDIVRRIRNGQLTLVLLFSHLYAAFDFTNRIEIVADDDPVLNTEAGLQALRL